MVKETDESLYWIEILEDEGILTNENTTKLRNEGLELLKIFSSSQKTVRLNRSSNKEITK